jgi:DNA-directed RNA polymerase specialized sigma24 family protein
MGMEANANRPAADHVHPDLIPQHRTQLLEAVDWHEVRRHARNRSWTFGEDAVGDVQERIWDKGIADELALTEITAFVTTCVHNRIIDLARQHTNRARRERAVGSLAVKEQNFETEVLVRSDITAVCDRLNPAERRIVDMLRHNDDDLGDIANTIGLTRSQFRHRRIALRHEFACHDPRRPTRRPS